MNVELFQKVKNFVFDSRMPPYFPWQVLRGLLRDRKMRASSVRPKEKLLFCFTVDVEQDHGSSWHRHGTDAPSHSTLVDFYSLFKTFAKEHHLKATFFVQGDLVQVSQPFLKQFQQEGHEMGLHGLHHELWCGARWFSKEKTLSRSAYEATLKKCLKIFGQARLRAPRSFRAPNFGIEKQTYKALQATGFRYDSSAPVYLGVAPLPQRKAGLNSIPVSVDPTPQFIWKRGLPVASFWVFNIHNVWKTDDHEIEKRLKNIVRFQKSHGVLPHVVFLIHSWEFRLDTHAKLVKAEERLRRMWRHLQQSFDIKFITFEQLNKILL